MITTWDCMLEGHPPGLLKYSGNRYHRALVLLSAKCLSSWVGALVFQSNLWILLKKLRSHVPLQKTQTTESLACHQEAVCLAPQQ